MIHSAGASFAVASVDWSTIQWEDKSMSAVEGDEVSPAECVRLAQLTDDQVLRSKLLNMARDWMADVTQEVDDSDIASNGG
jgi:hypothetical protein